MSAIGSAEESLLVQRVDVRFLCREKERPDYEALGAESQGRGTAARAGDAACCYEKRSIGVGGQGVGDFGEECDQAGAFFVAVAAGVGALDAEDVGLGGGGYGEGSGDGAGLDPDLGAGKGGAETGGPGRVVCVVGGGKEPEDGRFVFLKE